MEFGAPNERREAMVADADEVIETGQYGALKLQKYKGTWEVVACRKGGGTDGVWYEQWAYPQIYRNKEKTPMDKAFPQKIVLGDDRKAREVLTRLLTMLQREKPPY